MSAWHVQNGNSSIFTHKTLVKTALCHYQELSFFRYLYIVPFSCCRRKNESRQHFVAGVLQRHNPHVIQRHNPRVVQRHNPRVVFSPLPGQSQLQLEPLDVIKALTRIPLYMFTLKWHSLVDVWRLVHKRKKCTDSIPKKFQDILPLRISQIDIHLHGAAVCSTVLFNTILYSTVKQYNVTLLPCV